MKQPRYILSSHHHRLSSLLHRHRYHHHHQQKHQQNQQQLSSSLHDQKRKKLPEIEMSYTMNDTTKQGSHYRVLEISDREERVVPNFSLTVLGRGARWRRLDFEHLIQPNDTPDVILLKQRIMVMATEEIQILKQPDNYNHTTNASKESFRIEFDGILACLELTWNDWEENCFYPTSNTTFAELARQKIIGLKDLVRFQEVGDEELQERIVKLNRYHEDIIQRGQPMSRGAERLVVDNKVVRKRGFGLSKLSTIWEERRKSKQCYWEGGISSCLTLGFDGVKKRAYMSYCVDAV